MTKAWIALPERFPHVGLDAFVVMPNHVHGILILRKTGQEIHSPSLGQVLRAYKSLTGIAANRLLKRAEHPLWQRNYHERNIRDTDDYENIRRYIALNPSRWSGDAENPDNVPAPVSPAPVSVTL